MLNQVLTKDDVTVYIGNAICNITSIANEQLTCKPPTPAADGVGSNPAIVVSPFLTSQRCCSIVAKYTQKLTGIFLAIYTYQRMSFA